MASGSTALGTGPGPEEDLSRRVDRSGLPDPRLTYAGHHGVRRDRPISHENTPFSKSVRDPRARDDDDDDSDDAVSASDEEDGGDSEYDYYSEGYVRNQALLNTCFRQWNVSFADPENFCATLVPLLVTYRTILGEKGQQYADAYNEETNCIVLHDFLHEIESYRYHHHRLDAAIILAEIDNRIRGCQWRKLIPNPTRPPVKIESGEKRSFGIDPFPAETNTFWNSGSVFQTIPFTGGGPGQIAPIIQGLRCPPPPLKPRSAVPNPGLIPRGNLVYSIKLESRADNMSIAAEAGLSNLMSFGDLSQILGRPDPEMYLYDTPVDTYLPMPEGCRFLRQPELDTTDPDLQNMNIWPDLEIIDTRIAPENDPMSRVGKLHYLYLLFSKVREMVTHPSVARRFVVIFRAPPGSYGRYSNDELVNELPPTNEEIELVIQWFSKAFPKIHITRNLPHNVYGCQPRGEGIPHIEINAQLMDGIETGRNDMEVGHLLLLAFQTLVHELGHWLFSKVWHRFEHPGPAVVAQSLQNVKRSNITMRYNQAEVWPGRDGFTPRKMRFTIDPYLEDYDHPDYKWRQFPHYRGEMGQMIEWLVFGYHIDLPGSNQRMQGLGRYLGVLFHGSWPGQAHEREVQFTTYGAGRLLQSERHVWRHRDPPGARELAEFLRQEEILLRELIETSQLHIDAVLTLKACLKTPIHHYVDIYDADEKNIARDVGGDGPYRRAIQQICKERREVEHRRRGLRKQHGCIAPLARLAPQTPPTSIANGYPTLANRYFSISNIILLVLACYSYFYNYKLGLFSIPISVPSYIPEITVHELSSIIGAIFICLSFLLERWFLKLVGPTIISRTTLMRDSLSRRFPRLISTNAPPVADPTDVPIEADPADVPLVANPAT